MNKNSRRDFIKSSALLSIAALSTPGTVLASENPVNNNAALSAKGLTFLFQGDSITDGNRGRDADPNHIMGHGYAFRIASGISADFCTAGHKFYNRGISGNTTADLAARWQTDTIALQPDVLSILAGINDVDAVVNNKPNAQNITQFEANYRQLITEALTANPDIVIVLCLPFAAPVAPRKDAFESWKKATLERAAVVTKLSKEYNTVLVNFPEVLEGAIKKAPADYWIWDGIHPTIAFHTLMSREWVKQVGKKIHFLKNYSGA